MVRELVARSKVSIVLYHSPSIDTFESHLSYLSTRYAFIQLDDLVDAIWSGDWSKIPPKSLVITFDDGHRGNHELLPLLKKYRVTPTVYICSRIAVTGGDLSFMYDSAGPERMKQGSGRGEVEPENVSSKAAHAADCSAGRCGAGLDIEQIREMRKVVNFQSHTRLHRALPACDDDECISELINSKRDIEDIVENACRHLSFPHGTYDDRVIRYAQAAGYKSARTIDTGWNSRTTNPYKLKITGVSDDASIDKLVVDLSGITGYVRHFLKAGSLTGKAPQNDNGTRK